MRLYNPWEELDKMRDEMDRAFGAFLGRAPWRLSFLPGSGLHEVPSVNVSETERGYLVAALAPGVDAATFDVTVRGNALSISGEKKAPEGVKPESYQRSERALGKFSRVIHLPSQLDPEKVKAAYAEGILTVELEKAQAAKPRSIPVQLG